MSTTAQTPEARPAGKNRPTPKRPRQGVSGNPAKRAAAQARHDEHSDVDEAPERRRPAWLFLVLSALIVALVGGYTTAVMMAPVSTDSLVLLSLLTVPALVTMAFVPEARVTGLHRWPVAWVLGFTSMYPLPMLVAAQSWVLIRFWLVEHDPHLPFALLRRRPKGD